MLRSLHGSGWVKYKSGYQGRKAPFSLQRYPQHRICSFSWGMDDVFQQAQALQRTRRRRTRSPARNRSSISSVSSVLRGVYTSRTQGHSAVTSNMDGSRRSSPTAASQNYQQTLTDVILARHFLVVQRRTYINLSRTRFPERKRSTTTRTPSLRGSRSRCRRWMPTG